jgi:Acetoacetate decarboxylase (ADC)
MRDLSRDYIARGGEVAWIGPCGFRNVTLYGFAVKTDPMLVHDMFSRNIGEPSQNLGAHIDVRGTSLEHVLFVFIDSQRGQISYGPGSEGRYQERLFAVVVPGYRRSPNPGLVLFAPYLVASDTPGWEADREIYGFHRQHGHVLIDEGEMPHEFSVQAHVIQKFGPDEMTQELPFLHVRRGRPPQGYPIGAQHGNVRTLASMLRSTRIEPRGRRATRIVPPSRHGMTEADHSFFERAGGCFGARSAAQSSKAPINLEEVLNTGVLPMLFLKQFRDIAFPERACYQAIVEAPLDFRSRVDWTSHDYVLELRSFDSVPIGRELGIATDHAVPVDFAFRLEVEQMSLGAGTVISNPAWNPAVETVTPGESPRLPMYVDRGGEAVWRQPSLITGARMYGFGVRVSQEQQQKTLDRYINSVAKDSASTYGSRPFHLRPCTGVDVVMLLFVKYSKITSGNDDDKKLGGTSYGEFLAIQLAISDDVEYPELDWFIPYIALDRDSPRLCGREIFGYPKQLGTIEFDPYRESVGLLDPAKRLALRTTAIRKSTNEVAEPGVMVVEVVGPSTMPLARAHTSPQDMFFDLWAATGMQQGAQSLMGRLFPHIPLVAGAAGDGAVSLGPGVDVIRALFTNSIGDVFLKEFRDCRNPERACYQAVCKTDMIPTRFHGGGCLVDPSAYQIHIQDLASEPLLRVLGAAGDRAVLIPEFAFSLNLDLELTAGRVIANPFADNYSYSPDISLKRTPTEKRTRRVSPFAEPFWAR